MQLRNRWFPFLFAIAGAACGDDKPSDSVDGTVTDVAADSAEADASDVFIQPDWEFGEDAGPDTRNDTNSNRPTPQLAIGAITTGAICSGASISVDITLEGGDGDAYWVVLQLSDANGSFADPTYLGGANLSESGTLAGVIPERIAAGSAYRVRALIEDDVSVTSPDNGSDVQILRTPEATLVVTPRVAFAGEPVRFIDNTADITSRTWTFPSDASVASSTDKVVDLSFSAVGVKTITYEGVAANGCTISETLDNPFDSLEVVSCNPTIGAEARIYDLATGPTEEFGGSYDGWVCGGGELQAAGGQINIFVEPGATFEFTGGGGYVIYVKAGGTFIGGSGGQATIIAEPGAIIAKNHSSQVRLDCAALDFNYGVAPANGCVPAGTDPDAVTVAAGDFGAGPHCPGAELDVPFTLAGGVGASNHIIAQLSDASGSFDSATTFAAFPATASGNANISLPATLAAGSGYRVRFLTSHPPTVGGASAAFAVPEAAVARIGHRNGRKELVGNPITFTNNSDPYVSASWDFGDGANPATSTAQNGMTTYGTPGWKTITLTITDNLGCQSTATITRDPENFGSGLELLSCDVAVSPEAEVLNPGPHERVGGGPEFWVCGGARVSLFGGTAGAIIEENATFDFQGGGEHTFYARAGAIVGGGAGGLSTLVHETGAFVANGDDFTNVLECPVLTVTTDDAPSPGCAPWTPPEPAISLGEPDRTSICIDDSFSIPFTTEGLFTLDNTFALQASDATGNFTNATTIGTTNSPADGEIYARFRARDFTPGTGYRLRLTSAEPALVTAPTTTVVTLEEAPSIDFEAPWFVEPGEVFSVTNTTAGSPSFVWTINDEPWSTERNPTHTFTDFGTYYIEVTASTSAGCSDDYSHTVKIVGCAPPIPPEAMVVTRNSTGHFGGQKRFWVCDGGTVEAGAGDYNIYVEDGGTFTFTGGGVYSVYVKAGGTYNGGFGGIVSVYAEEGAILNLSGNERLVKTCAPLTFDTSLAPVSGCQ